LPKSLCEHSGQGDEAFQKKPHHPFGEVEQGFSERVPEATEFGQQPVNVLLSLLVICHLQLKQAAWLWKHFP
jgi:hypothetical protein